VIAALDLANDSELPDPPGKPLVEESRRALPGLPAGRSDLRGFSAKSALIVTMERTGIEPVTSGLQSRRSPS
jgi:hypothetical protein